MSHLFKQISQEAAKQQQQLDQMNVPASASRQGQPQFQYDLDHTAEQPSQPQASQPRTKPPTPKAKKMAPPFGTTAPATGTTAPLLDWDKLATVMRELSQLPTNNNGLNVRISEQEAHDLEELIHERLRKRGLRGNTVSAAKLMRYAFRYLTRVHEREFMAALERAFKVEEKLSI